MESENHEYYISDDLAFVACAILSGKVTIKKVTFHPNKQGIKEYHLSPREVAKQLFLEFVSDQLKVSPKQLSDKVVAIKHLPAETERREGNYGY